MDLKTLFSFPNPVNEKAARTVAAIVVLFAVLILATGWQWLIVPLAIGFWLRVAAGPRFSPSGLIATKLVAPRLGEPKLVPGPPKRFAQSIGAALTTVAAILGLGFGLSAVATVLIAVLLVFALLESALGFCAGCQMFALLMRAGAIPEETCEACNNIWARTPSPSPAGSSS